MRRVYRDLLDSDDQSFAEFDSLTVTIKVLLDLTPDSDDQSFAGFDSLTVTIKVLLDLTP